ncbi:Tetraacyldisaccharide 4'-kinase, partial [Bienertia sinuspersici]
EVEVDLMKMGDRFIDATIKEPNNFVWRVSGVYGWLESSQKHKTWSLMKDLGEQSELPWMIFGDFNEVLFESEKKGRNPCDPVILRQCDDDLVEKRLDRVLVTGAWRGEFPLACVNNLTLDSSDHTPLVIHLKGEWDHVTFKQVPRRIQWLKRRLTRLGEMAQTAIVAEEPRQVEKELRFLRRSKETAAWQRCRPMILRDGDINTACCC